ncbi:MAG: hypothetical protein RIR51_372 [Bacteroidota bacterium]
MKKSLYILFSFILISSCSEKKDTLFLEISSKDSGIDFVNRSLEKKEFNIFNYRNFYNGGGVAIGDVNNDGLADIFLTSNFEENKLYLNQGDFKFKDISSESGINESKFWSTGVTFADVNGDGLLDIYVCNSGSRDDRGNQLFLNQGIKNGIPSFKNIAQEVGLLDGGLSTHAAFFDYDNDGDLDMYLLNNSFTPIDRLGYTNLRNERDRLGGDKFFKNLLAESGDLKFEDVSEKAGIYGSLIGFGLGITIGDVNNDGWQDIYISNDFYERDYLYINQKNGSFKEDLENQMPHISLSSMGADIADINNDGNLDIFVTDMLPGNDYRLKTTSVFEGHNLVRLKESRGFWNQYMRNNLHLNNGDDTFTEIGQFSGVHATDWSWGALIFDMDNDGKKDLYVANGILKNLTDQDFVQYLGDRNTMQAMLNGKKFDYKEFTDKMTSDPISNYAYKNNGNLKFTNLVEDWGLKGPGFSNGSAYGDLDNDGDLDLVVNNQNNPVSIYKNQSNEKFGYHFLKLNIEGDSYNKFGVGAKIILYQSNESQVLHQMPNRGFQSSSDLSLVFGLGNNPSIDSLRIIWPNFKTELIKNPKADQILNLKIQNAKDTYSFKSNPIQNGYFENLQGALEYTHKENEFMDYDRDVLIKQKFSTLGPALATGDINGDGREDIFIGGASGYENKVFLQNPDGRFTPKPFVKFNPKSEAVDAVLVDVDQDNDLDLIVVTGGNEFEEKDPELADELYLNDGKGNFKYSLGLPGLNDFGSCISVSDFDHDGDIDLFIGSRMIPGKYGLDPRSSLLVNNGRGEFVNYSKRYMEDIENLGMVTDAQFGDIDGDGWDDLIIVQDWGSIKVYHNKKGRKFESTTIPGTEGMWKSIQLADTDGDGDLDFIAGNIGQNSKIFCSPEHPAKMEINDFDLNGSYEQIISCITEDGQSYPMALKNELAKAIPSIQTKFLKYKDFASKKTEELFSQEQLKGMITKEIVEDKTLVFENDGKGNFVAKELPYQVQLSSIFTSIVRDFDKDGKPDLYLLGNFFDYLPEFGKQDGNYGVLLRGLGKNQFEFVPNKKSGILIKGQVRHSAIVPSSKGDLIILVKNNESAQTIKIK